MKHTILSLLLAICCITVAAQAPAGAQSATSAQSTDTLPLPEYAYCEIIAQHLPAANKSGVLFDFGQPTKTWVNNWLLNDNGERLNFNSGIEALNYMVRQGW